MTPPAAGLRGLFLFHSHFPPDICAAREPWQQYQWHQLLHRERRPRRHKLKRAAALDWSFEYHPGISAIWIPYWKKSIGNGKLKQNSDEPWPTEDKYSMMRSRYLECRKWCILDISIKIKMLHLWNSMIWHLISEKGPWWRQALRSTTNKAKKFNFEIGTLPDPGLKQK